MAGTGDQIGDQMHDILGTLDTKSKPMCEGLPHFELD